MAEENVEVVATFVAESSELENLIGSVVASKIGAMLPWSVYSRIQQILEKYKEQAQLLDPHLEMVVFPLMDFLREQASLDSSEQDLLRTQRVCYLINILFNVRGYKTVIKFFPHEAADLERTLRLLLACDHFNQRCEAERAQKGFERVEVLADDGWEVQAVLLAWMSILVIIPFPLHTLDSAITQDGSSASSASGVSSAAVDSSHSCAAPVGLEKRIIDCCVSHLSSPGVPRDMSGVVLGRLLTRPDSPHLLEHFTRHTALPTLLQLTSSNQEQHTDKDKDKEDETIMASPPQAHPTSVFLVPGVMRSLTLSFKLGSRHLLTSLATPVLEVVLSPRVAGVLQGNCLVRKLAVRLVSNLGLVFLPPRVAAWRYQRGSRSLVANLHGGGGGEVQGGAQQMQQQGGGGEIAGKNEVAGKNEAEGENEAMSLSEETLDRLEEVVEFLLQGLRDQDTVVRWAAAKGLGRVTGRLPLCLANDTLEAVMQLFTPIEGDAAWHGGCLAVAELARRGLLLPHSLCQVVPVVVSALQYDVRRGSHSVGAHVRDAAAYVTWAFARAYSPQVMAPWLATLAPPLLTMAVFDREVNCRRAASAAFQEGVGRLGNFPHGMDLVGCTDYHDIGLRPNAYCTVAAKVAAFDLYCTPLIEHLVYVKLRHWERSVRELASKALGTLVCRSAELCAGAEVAGVLLTSALSQDLPTRHGSTLAVAEVLDALVAAGHPLSQDLKEQVSSLVPAIEKARLYRGKGGELMRIAVCQVIGSVARVPLELTPQRRKMLHASLDENLKHPNPDIIKSAAGALIAFTSAYIPTRVSPEAVLRTSGKYGPMAVGDENPAARRGAALALGCLPRRVLLADHTQVVEALGSASQVEADPDRRDVDTRVYAVRSLVKVCEMTHNREIEIQSPEINESEMEKTDPMVPTEPSGGRVTITVKEVITRYLLSALQDYTTDSRGDVGSLVRAEAILGLERCVFLLCHGRAMEIANSDIEDADLATDADVPAELDAELAQMVVAGMLKQAVEKIDRVREVAARSLVRTLRQCKAALTPLLQDQLMDLVRSPDTQAPNWDPRCAATTLPVLLPLLHCSPLYHRSLVSGLVVLLGGIDRPLSQVGMTALLPVLKSNQTGEVPPGVAEEVGRCLLEVAQESAGDDRVMVPWMRTLDVLFSAQCFQTMPPNHHFHQQVLDVVRSEVKGCKDLPKLKAMVLVLCHLCSKPGQSASEPPLQALLVMLANRYPQVRKFTAEQLYVRLLTAEGEQDEGDEEGEGMEEAMEVLSLTRWDSSLQEVKEARMKLYAPLGLTPPASAKAAPSKSQKAGPSQADDEHASYASLVDTVGY